MVVPVLPDDRSEKNSYAMASTHAISEPDWPILAAWSEITVIEGFMLGSENDASWDCILKYIKKSDTKDLQSR